MLVPSGKTWIQSWFLRLGWLRRQKARPRRPANGWSLASAHGAEFAIVSAEGLERRALLSGGSPAVSADMAAVIATEGALAKNSGLFSAADGTGAVTIAASVGTVTQDDALGTWAWNYTPADDSPLPQSVTITATADDSSTASTAFDLSVHNVTPALALDQMAAINESQSATLTGRFTDPGVFDSHTLAVGWGDPHDTAPSSFILGATSTLVAGQTFSSSTDGAVLTIAAVDVSEGTVGFSVQHQYAESGQSRIDVTVTDDGASDSTDPAAASPVFMANVMMLPSVFSGPVATGNSVYFVGSDAASGMELWKSDGTTAGTQVFDLVPGPAGSYPYEMVDVNGTLYFSPTTPEFGWELWKIDGSGGGPQLVTDLAPGADSSVPMELTNVGGKLFFSAANPTNSGYGLWTSDGTAEGTVFVKDVTVLPSPFSKPVVIGNTMYFFGSDEFSGTELWKSDGTTAGTQAIDLVPGPEGSNPYDMVDVNGTLYFSATTAEFGWELWKTDGSVAGTQLVADVLPGPAGSGPMVLTNVDGTLFFSAANPTGTGGGLWTSDGTAAGTVFVKDVTVLPLVFGKPTVIGNTFYFFGADVTSGSELWQSDGTTAGTNAIELVPGPAGSNPFDAVNVNGTLFFSATTPESGWELWKIDGPGASPQLVADLAPGPDASAPMELTAVGETMYFSATNPTQTGFGLWRLGIPAVTVTIKNVAPALALDQIAPINENQIATLTGRFTDPGVFDAHSVVVGWGDPNNAATSSFNLGSVGTLVAGQTYSSSTDGAILTITEVDSSAGTVGFLVQHLYLDDGQFRIDVTVTDDDGASDSTNIDQASPVFVQSVMVLPSAFSGPVTVGNNLYFVGSDPATGMELWTSDGTTNGTHVFDLVPGPVGSNPLSMVNVNGTLFFSAMTADTGYELWKTDGTDAGTQLVADLAPGPDSSMPMNLTNVGGTLFFATQGSPGYALWKSDGTAAGTVIVKDVMVLPSAYSGPVAIGNNLYFVGYDPATGMELWTSDGTTNGTHVFDLVPGPVGSNPLSMVNVNGTLFFSAMTADTGYELWKTDGTDAGTQLVADLAPGPDSSMPMNLTNVGGTLFFATQGSPGYALWKSDGTAAGTVIVKDVMVLPSAYSGPVAIGNNLYFVGYDPATGMELWTSDGTTDGTHVIDLVPGPFGSNPLDMANVNGTLFFSAMTLDSGYELWKTDGTDAGTQLVADLTPGPDSSMPMKLTNVGGALFFATQSSPGYALWRLGAPPVTVTVNNVAPDFNAGPDATLAPSAAGAFSRTGIFVTDPGTLDVLSGTVDYGDGPGQPLTINQSARTFSLAHIYSASGTYTVTVTVNDGDGGSHTDAFQLDVQLAPAETTAILLLDATGAGALSASGNGKIIVGGTGEIVVASTSSAAVLVSGNASVTAAELELESTTGTQTSGHGQINGVITRGVPASEAADPLATLAEPTAPATQFAAVNISGNAVITLQPGKYNGGIRISGNAKVTLAAGIYYLNGGGFSVSGNAVVTGIGVLIYNAPGSTSDSINISGNARVTLSAQTTGTYQGIVLFQSRTSAAPINITSKGALILTGTLYARAARINVSGTGLLQLLEAGSELIAADLIVTGNGVVKVNA